MYVTGRQRHNQAILAPSGKDEKAIVQLFRGLTEYHKLLELSETDAVRAILKQGLSDIARGLQKLTQGPLGRLDAAILSEDLAPFIQDSNLSLVGSEAEAVDSAEQHIAATDDQRQYIQHRASRNKKRKPGKRAG
jgi:hypothetical protein